MGNHMSCVSPAADDRHPMQDYGSTDDDDLCCPSKQKMMMVVRILHVQTGIISDLKGPITAAEVMLEYCPAMFLCCHSTSSSNGRRISAVPADAELRAGELYILLPMSRLNTRFSAEQMDAIAALAGGGQCLKGIQNSAHSKQSKGAASVLGNKVAPFPLMPFTSDGGSRSSEDSVISAPAAIIHGPYSASTAVVDATTQPLNIWNLVVDAGAKLSSMQGDHFRLPSALNILNNGRCAPHLMCRSKSWMPALPTISEVGM